MSLRIFIDVFHVLFQFFYFNANIGTGRLTAWQSEVLSLGYFLIKNKMCAIPLCVHIYMKLTAASQYISTLWSVSIKPNKEIEFSNTFYLYKFLKNKQVAKYLTLYNAQNQRKGAA